MKESTKIIVFGSMLNTIITYLLGCFITAEVDYTLWTQEGRVLYVFLMSMIEVFVFVGYFVKKDEEKVNKQAVKFQNNVKSN